MFKFWSEAISRRLESIQNRRAVNAKIQRDLAVATWRAQAEANKKVLKFK